MKIDYNDINSVNVGSKYILDNALGIIKEVEKTKVVVKVIDIIDNKKVKVEINSMLNKMIVQSEVDFYLLQ